VTALFLYDDAKARGFEPFALTRPVSELRAGTAIIRERWEQVAGIRAVGALCSSHLADFSEENAPPVPSGDTVIPKGSVVANSRFLPSLDSRLAGGVAFSGGFVCAVRLKTDMKASDFADGQLTLDKLGGNATGTEMKGRWVNAIWEIIATLGDQLKEDIPTLAKSLKLQKTTGEVTGSGDVFIEEGAKVDPFEAFDASAGPILVRAGASIASFSRLVGPLYIGEHVTVMGDFISACSIGEWCKVRGEMSNTVMLGHSNKGHTGFIGHSYLGRWVNLGSGTTTSNLKNTYGTVQIWSPGGMVDTGMQFLGTLFGDHAKTGIGMMLTTGSVIGAGANIFGTTMPPKAVAPFSWGDAEPYSTFEEEKFLDVAARVMSRRHVELDDRGRRHLKTCYSRRWR
jgi:UDP-N-acetylglucosamine diphosphorylase/glucosamine-1-phosphate N-acetyltransferase